MDNNENCANEFEFGWFISDTVKCVVNELITRFGVAYIASNHEKIRIMFHDEIDKYLKN